MSLTETTQRQILVLNNCYGNNNGNNRCSNLNQLNNYRDGVNISSDISTNSMVILYNKKKTGRIKLWKKQQNTQEVDQVSI